MVRRTSLLGSPLVSCAVRALLGAVLVQTRIQGPANKEQPYASIVYTAVARGKVALPCDISPPTPDDSVTLVLWYKDESLAPIFTLDSRRAHVDQARQSLSGHGLDHRAHFNMANQPAFLQIDPVEEADAGEYRCRVDFRRGRSINTVIHLNVIATRRVSRNNTESSLAYPLAAPRLFEIVPGIRERRIKASSRAKRPVPGSQATAVFQHPARDD
ncbi:hypothetical protein MTO96_007386 [Rhipicephalus appendiculatus]